MFVALLFTIFLLFIIWVIMMDHKKRAIFKELNLKHFKPYFIVGNSFEILMGWMHQSEKLDSLYRAFPEEEAVAFCDLFFSTIVVRSAELVDAILVQNFSNFHDRIFQEDKIERPEDANLFGLTGNLWRAVRYKLSPLFTSGKMKFMYHSMADCGKTLVSVLEEEEGKDVEMADVMDSFAIDVIGSTAFGVESNLLRNPNSEFKVKAKTLFAGSFIGNLRAAFFVFFPKLAKMLSITSISSKKINNYFFDILRNTIQERKESGRQRNDFVEMLLQLKKKGKVEVQICESGEDYLLQDNTNDTFELEITDDLLIGSAFTFFIAGFHSTSVTLIYALYELTRCPEVEAKLRQEIASVVQGEEPTYDELRKMTYLENVIKETLRLHPSSPSLGRTCTREYTSPAGHVFKQGQMVLIPVLSIQTDPAYWPDPLVFNPDRFQDTPKPGTFLPFGAGPRICIAIRFAMMEMKFALAKLLTNYKIQLSEKTKLPLKIDPRMFLTTPAQALYFRVTKMK